MTRDRRSEVLARELATVWSDPDSSPLRLRRLAASLSQQELADRAGLGVATVARTERTGSASSETWSKLCVALGARRVELDPEFRRMMSPFLREVA